MASLIYLPVACISAGQWAWELANRGLVAKLYGRQLHHGNLSSRARNESSPILTDGGVESIAEEHMLRRVDAFRKRGRSGCEKDSGKVLQYNDSESVIVHSAYWTASPDPECLLWATPLFESCRVSSEDLRTLPELALLVS